MCLVLPNEYVLDNIDTYIVRKLLWQNDFYKNYKIYLVVLEGKLGGKESAWRKNSSWICNEMFEVRTFDKDSRGGISGFKNIKELWKECMIKCVIVSWFYYKIFETKFWKLLLHSSVNIWSYI